MEQKDNLKIIVFDFDGTIADTKETLTLIYNRIAREKGLRIMDKDYRELLSGKPPREILKAAGISVYQVPSFLLRVRKELKEFLPQLGMHPGIAELLYALKEIDICLIIMSSNSKENIENFLKRNNVDVFNFIYCGSSFFGKAKVLKKIIKNSQVANEQILYIGDEVRDIEAARQAKVKIVCVGWGLNNKTVLLENKPDALAETPKQLLSLIKDLWQVPEKI